MNPLVMESIDTYDSAIYRLQPVESLANSAAVLLNESCFAETAVRAVPDGAKPNWIRKKAQNSIKFSLLQL